MADHLIRGAGLTLAGGVFALVLAGCGTPTTPAPDGENATTGPSAVTASPSPAVPTRSVSAKNLIVPDDIPIDDPTYKTVVETPDGAGRSVTESYVCLPSDGLTSLGASAMVTRNFAYRIDDPKKDLAPKSPLKNQPVIYTQALQFPDEAAASKARETYVDWIMKCPATLTEKGYTIDSAQSFPPTKVDVEGGRAQVGMVAYVKPGESNARNLFWESAGVTQVKDRLMITVSLSWGEDTPGTLDDTESDFIHPQVILVEESAIRLAE